MLQALENLLKGNKAETKTNLQKAKKEINKFYIKK